MNSFILDIEHKCSQFLCLPFGRCKRQGKHTRNGTDSPSEPKKQNKSDTEIMGFNHRWVDFQLLIEFDCIAVVTVF